MSSTIARNDPGMDEREMVETNGMLPGQGQRHRVAPPCPVGETATERLLAEIARDVHPVLPAPSSIDSAEGMLGDASVAHPRLPELRAALRAEHGDRPRRTLHTAYRSVTLEARTPSR